MPPLTPRTSSGHVAEVLDGDEVREDRRADHGLARLDAPDRRDLFGDLRAGQVPAGTGLGALAALEVERLAARDLVEAPAEPRRREFVEVPAVGGLLLGEHSAFARADSGAGELGACGERALGLLGERAEAHVAHEEWHFQAKRLRCARPDDEFGADGLGLGKQPAR